MVSRAGLPLQDMEFVQFHPSGIYGAGVRDSTALILPCLLPHTLNPGSHHRGRPRRRRLPRQWPGRALHGALRAHSQGPRIAGRCEPQHESGNHAGPRLRAAKRPHSPPAFPSPARRHSRASAGHRGNSRHLRGHRHYARAHPRATHGALLHGRHPDKLPRPSPQCGPRDGP